MTGSSSCASLVPSFDAKRSLLLLVNAPPSSILTLYDLIPTFPSQVPFFHVLSLMLVGHTLQFNLGSVVGDA